MEQVEHPKQARVVRECAARIASGEALYAVAPDLNARGVPATRHAGRMTYTCHVCGQAVQPDAEGKVRLEGITPADSKAWVWGPVPLHEDCRVSLTTPYDDQIGDGYVATWQRMTA